MSPSPGGALPTPQSQSFIDLPSTHDQNPERPPTPVAPPYSPITPLLTAAELGSGDYEYPYGPPEHASCPPPPIPFSESDNPDAMALRSAISILQMQRRTCQRDMKTLEEQKKVALANPKGFAVAVAAGNVKTAGSGGLVVGPNPQWMGSLAEGFQSGSDDSDFDHEGKTTGTSREFMDIPGPQNIVRCPPINWAKYHVVGGSLDKLHQEQQKRPTPGQPYIDEEPTEAPEHVIAAPYNPWTDKLPESSMRTRSVAKKEC